MKILILGSSADKGFPKRKGKNRRLRSAIALKENKQWILIDAGPDIYEQLKQAKIKPDFVFITHAHPDHILGICDLIKISPRVKILAPNKVLQDLKKKRFIRKLNLTFQEVPEDKWFLLRDFRSYFLFSKVQHSKIVFTYAVAVRRNKKIILFYTPDLKKLLKQSKKIFSQAENLILDGSILNRALNVHASIKQQIKWCRSIKAKKIYFTHIGKEPASLGHKKLVNIIKKMDSRALVCWDGMGIEI